MEKIRIPYDDYKDLLDQSAMLDSIIHDFIYEIEESDLAYGDDELRFDKNLLYYIKKYLSKDYTNKLLKLKRERESEK